MPRVSRMTSVGSSRSTIGCGLSSKNTRTRGLSTTARISAIVTQNLVLGVTTVCFAGTKQHPEHRHEADEGNGTGHRDDDDISPKRPDQMVLHDDLHFICPWRVRLPLVASLSACRGCPTSSARN